MKGTSLYKANLRGARLTEASLSETKLKRASLVGADLRGAILNRVDLTEADIIHAKLDNVKVTGGSFQGVKFGEKTSFVGMKGKPNRVYPALRDRLKREREVVKDRTPNKEPKRTATPHA